MLLSDQSAKKPDCIRDEPPNIPFMKNPTLFTIMGLESQEYSWAMLAPEMSIEPLNKSFIFYHPEELFFVKHDKTEFYGLVKF